MLKQIIEELNEIKGNMDPKAKKLAKKIAKAKGRVKCSGNKTPQKVPTSGNTIKYKCTTKDKVKARKMSKARKKFNKTSASKRSVKITKKTKEFRK